MASASRLSSVVDQAITIQPCKEDLIFAIASCAEVGDRPWLRAAVDVELDPRPHQCAGALGLPTRVKAGATLAKPTITVDRK